MISNNNAGRNLLLVISLSLIITISGCATHGQLSQFASDGCSLFPDRSWISKADWCDCCFIHDFRYWQGGSSILRKQADHELKRCVQEHTNNVTLANSMYLGVRVGGSPYFPTPYRWAYGWRYGRFYHELNTAEQSEVDKSFSASSKNYPLLICPKL